MAFLANRYKDGSEFGRVHAWEVWNEQNTGGETGNNVDAGAYVEVLKASYRRHQERPTRRRSSSSAA